MHTGESDRSHRSLVLSLYWDLPPLDHGSTYRRRPSRCQLFAAPSYATPVGLSWLTRILLLCCSNRYRHIWQHVSVPVQFGLFSLLYRDPTPVFKDHLCEETTLSDPEKGQIPHLFSPLWPVCTSNTSSYLFIHPVMLQQWFFGLHVLLTYILDGQVLFRWNYFTLVPLASCASVTCFPDKHHSCTRHTTFVTLKKKHFHSKYGMKMATNAFKWHETKVMQMISKVDENTYIYWSVLSRYLLPIQHKHSYFNSAWELILLKEVLTDKFEVQSVCRYWLIDI